jgi:YHS domain-containing protein
VLRTLLLLILVLVVLRFVWRLLGAVMQAAGGGQAQGGRRAAPPAVRMVQDPVCGTYVVPGKSLELSRGRETLFFCSEKCRSQYLEPRR